MKTTRHKVVLFPENWTIVMISKNLKFIIGPELPFEQVVALYNSVGWAAYTNEQEKPKLPLAIQNSTYVVSAWYEDQLIGLARCLSDDVSIFYLQDILVQPDFQHQGVGRQLLTNCLERFAHVRMKVLLTGNEAKQIKFYESMGYKNTKDLQQIPLNAFVQVKGIDLT
jgi:ribosomal protein S18 acetylase RimI-like enzyme